MTEPSHTNPREYVPVYTALGQLAGEMVRLMLEAHGIPAMLSQESAGSTFGFTVGPLGQATVLVPILYEADALELISAMEEGRLEPPPSTNLSPAEHKYKNNKIPPDEAIKPI